MMFNVCAEMIIISAKFEYLMKFKRTTRISMTNLILVGVNVIQSRSNPVIMWKSSGVLG